MRQNAEYKVREISDLKDMLNQSAVLYKDNAAFKIKDESENISAITYAEFKNDVDSLGTALIALGLKDKFIAIHSENRYEWSTSYLAVVNGTGVVVPLDKELPVNETENLLIRSNTAALVYSGRYHEEFKQLAASLPNVEYFVNMDADEDEGIFLSYKKLLKKGAVLMESGDRSFLDAEIDPNVMKILLFTSGTTDLAKGVMISHKNLCSNLMAVIKVIKIDDSDSMLSILPLHHTYECTCGFLAPLYCGCSIAFNEGLKHIGKNLKEYSPSLVLVVPLMLEGMYKKIWDGAAKKGKLKLVKTMLKISNFLRHLGIDLRSKLFNSILESFGGKLRLSVSGAAALEPTVAKGLRDFGLHTIQGYGLTECSPIVTANRIDNYKDHSIGLPIPGVEVKLADTDEDGVGELIVRGDNVMLGYFNNPEATANVLKGGWFYTGDLGTIDEDGFYTITGRKKNVIIAKNGKNVFPEEVEAYLNKSPYILESLVSCKEGNGHDENTVYAQIVPDLEMMKLLLGKEEFGRDEIQSLISAEVKAANKLMSSYKRVDNFEIRDTEFAKTTTRKIKRFVER